MLGFDAIGVLPLGSGPRQSSVTVPLVADPGSYVLTGQATVSRFAMATAAGAYNITGVAVTFGGSFKAQSGSYGLTGHAAALSSSLAAASGQYSVAGSDAALRTRQPAGSGVYALSGAPVAFGSRFAAEAGSYSITGTGTLVPVVMIADAGRYVLTLGKYTLIRSGYDYEPGYAGLGHYLEEQVRLRKLAKIVRKTPRPVISAVPALPQIAPTPDIPQVDAGILNGVQALQNNQPDRAAIRKQAQRKAALALLLAA